MCKKIFVKSTDVSVCGICEGKFHKKQSNSKICPTCLFLGMSDMNSDIPEKGQVSDNYGILKYNSERINLKEELIFNLNEDENSFLEKGIISADDLIEKTELSSEIDKILLQLNGRENTVIKMRFGLLEDKSDRTLEEIGYELSVTKERIREIEYNVIRKLKHPNFARDLMYLYSSYIE